MKPLMKTIDTPDQVFHDGNPSTGELGTICSAEWLNDTQASIRDIQAECIAILRANGLEPDETKRDQLWQAIQAAIKSKVPAATLTTAGISLLSSSVTSNSETVAATSKAVKIAMDNANERLAKARNLADLQSVPLALANLTLANVKKAVEDTQIGLSKLPKFLPTSEDELDALPVGFIGECRNKTPGGPLPTEKWCYIQKTGNLNNCADNPKRKGGTIRLTCIHNAGETWTGAKFDDGTTEGKHYEWARDFSTLNKPTPEDVGLAATKKAIDDTQTGLAVQGVMWITSADDLSNLPSGARRFASNKAPATVLPAAGYFFLEVLAKRDTGNGSCILATNDAGDVWMGVRYTVPNDAAFTWIQLNQNVQNLGLTDTVNRASHVKATDGDLYGTQWGGWLSSYIRRNTPSVPSLTPYATTTWVNQNFITRVKRGEPVNPGKVNEYGPAEAPAGCVVTSVRHDPTTAYGIYFTYRPLSIFINGGWRVIEG
ncbi:hypothetical protein FAL72_03830 [Salmonella enterica]|nr:hypothetical protein [Salmonella enterica]